MSVQIDKMIEEIIQMTNDESEDAGRIVFCIGDMSGEPVSTGVAQ